MVDKPSSTCATIVASHLALRRGLGTFALSSLTESTLTPTSHVTHVRKVIIVRISLMQISDSPVLAGAFNGKIAFAEMIKAISDEGVVPQPLFLDFVGIEVATASYLRESVFALKTYMRTKSSSYYPVVANANSDVWDELSVIAHAKNDVIVSCELANDGCASNVELIGNLDPKQRLTFELVLKFKQVDANSLMEQFGEAEKTKSTTAWNNRLASLASRGIIREYSKGRSKYYRPLLTERAYGN